jgi:hypothetical protein
MLNHGFVFKFVFEFNSQKDNVPIFAKGVKKATYFYDFTSQVMVEEVINEFCKKENTLLIKKFMKLEKSVPKSKRPENFILVIYCLVC